MADRYRLPEALGGGEVAGRVIRTGISVGYGDMPVVLADVDGVGEIAVPLSAVTKMEPPEPPPGSMVRAREGGVYERGAGDIWFRRELNSNLTYNWAQVCAEGGFVRLVPDPAVGVELPWRLPLPHGGGAINVSLADVGDAGKGVALVSTPGPYVLDASDARAMATALLAAADWAGVAR